MITRADVNDIGGSARVETILTGEYGAAADTTSTRRFPDPAPGTTILELSATIETFVPIPLDVSQTANDRFRAFTFSSMFSTESEYDANLIRFQDSTGTVQSIPLDNLTNRGAHLLPAAVEIGSWIEFVKTPGSTFNAGSPSIRVDILSIDGYAGRLGFQGFLALSLLTSDDSLSGWIELLDVPDTLPSGTNYTVHLQVTAFQIPEPSSLVLVAIGIAVLCLSRAGCAPWRLVKLSRLVLNRPKR